MLNELILGRALYCRRREFNEGIIVSSWMAVKRTSRSWFGTRTR